MTWTVTTLPIKDGGLVSRNFRFIDESGSGSGPFWPFHRISHETIYPVFSAGFDIDGYATPTDLFAIIGSATKTVKISKISLTGQASSQAQIDVVLLKRSTANSGGSPTSITAVAHDSADSAASASVVTYGTAPTLGTLVGSLRDTQLTLPGSTFSFATSRVEWDFQKSGSKPIVLRGVNELLTLNLQGAALPSGMHLSCDIEWIEAS